MTNRGLNTLIILLVFIGVIVHFIPLSSQERMINSISDDGYLMMTIARNMALGNGMSVSNGEIPTNGTQPLATGLWAVGYWLFDGDKIKGIAWVILLQFVLATLSALLIWQGGKRLLQPSPDAGIIAGFAAAIWYASPILAGHTMNGLETALYTLCIILAAMLFSFSKTSWPMRYWLGFGVLLGLCFWARNDATFFIFAVCIIHLLSGPFDLTTFKKRFVQVLVMGSTSVVVALPWLINNVLNFGNIMPISGQSESLLAEFGDNLHFIPVILTEYVFVFLPVPQVIGSQFIVKLLCVIVLFILPILLLIQQLSPQIRRLSLSILIYTVCLIGFYGLFFGAANFLARYFFPTTPFFVLLWASLIVISWRYLQQRLPLIIPVATVLFIGIIVGLHARSYLFTKQSGGYHQYLGGFSRHFQFVEWVRDNASETTWVGAWQSGTIGYFHDYTINLDGKTNPEALEARREKRIPEYMIQKEIKYFLDWAAFVVWKEKPVLKDNFSVIVEDKSKNLVVFQRNVN
ncbi:glycosyltransferase family 39 protein [Candidatus Halobeggiatoa sp. HSG11]|nr:glycosyltransferase family 39 protein [Candidatus Halobeggiatoa sp. HSG11]